MPTVAQEDEPLAGDKIHWIRAVLSNFKYSLDTESISYSELADIDALYDIVKGYK